MTDMRYCAAAPSSLRLVTLGDLTAIFDCRSMQTHLVAPPLPEILAAMGDHEWDAAGLVKQLGREFDLGDADPLAIVAERLSELEALGLVARA